MHNTGQNGGTIDADIDAIEAWDISTGGVTPLGDTIVVAIVDGGMLLTHADLIPNLWTNWEEIPGNGIDDDNNGYIDCLLYTSPSPRDRQKSRMPSSA